MNAARHLSLAAQNDAGAIAAEATIGEGEELIASVQRGELLDTSAVARLGGLARHGRPAIPQNGERLMSDLPMSYKEIEQAQALAANADAVRGAIKTSKAGNSPITLGRLERVA